MTSFKQVSDRFFSLITDDMYLEISPSQTEADCEGLLLSSIHLFEFPKQSLNFVENEEGEKTFSADLTLEEQNILAHGMLQIWLQRQLNSVELMRQKFSGPDFKLSSQASHLRALVAQLKEARDEHYRLQTLYSRRREKDGKYESTFDLLVKRKGS